MASTENTEIDNDKDELACLELIEINEPDNSLDSEGNMSVNFVNKDVLPESKDESCETISKNVEDMLLGGAKEPGDSDNQDDEMELRWEDDDDDIKNEGALLEGTSDSPKSYPLSLQEEVIKTIEAEEKLLESENDESKETPTDSTSDSAFIPKMDHNLNKPDMMLEIPSHELIEFSDDEDLTNNLEMSPDIDTDEEASILNEVEETQGDEHTNEKELTEENPKETILDENALENEAKLAAEILTKELNAMDTDSNIIAEEAEMDKEITEEVVNKEDDTTQEHIDQIEEEKKDKEESPEKEINMEQDTIISEEENQEDKIEDMENEIAGLCEEILLSVTDRQTDVTSDVKENTAINPELSDLPERDLNSDTSDNNITKDTVGELTSIEAEVSNNKANTTQETTITSQNLAELDKILSPVNTSSPDENMDTNILETISSTKQSEDKRENVNEPIIETVNEPIIETVNDPVKETSISHPQPSKSSESEIIQKKKEEIDSASDKAKDDIATTEVKDSQLITNKLDTPKIDEQLTKTELQSNKLNIENQEVNSEINDPIPSTSGTNLDIGRSKQKSSATDQEADKIEHATNVPDEPINNETIVDVPAHSMDIDDPQPSTSFACLEMPKISVQTMFGSSMVQDTSNDVPEMTDSLGLLAESSRVMEEDEEQEYDDDGDGEDEDDFDQDQDDESSNQMTAEHSEDSNAQHSESEVQKEHDTTADKPFTFTITDVASEADRPEAMECDDAETTEKPPEPSETDSDLQKDNDKEDKPIEAMEIETVKLSDISDTEVDMETGEKTIQKSLLIKENDTQTPQKIEKQSPNKTKTLEIVKQDTAKILSFVDLEESSSEDDVQETKESPQLPETKPEATIADLPKDITLEVNVDVKKIENEVDSETQKASPSKSKTPEVPEETKSSSAGNSTLAIKANKPKSFNGLEVFNLDSDEDEPPKMKEEKPIEETKEVVKPESVKCINKLCSSATDVEYYIADIEAIKFYDADKKKRGYVCQNCADAVEKRNQELITGIRNFAPLLELGINRSGDDLVEISDSESEDEAELDQDQVQLIGTEGAKVAEEKLAKMINETWEKFKMDARLMDTQSTLQKEMEKLQKESAEINDLLNECQVATDQLRNELYSTFEPDIRELPAFVIYDMPNCTYSCVEPASVKEYTPKRRRSSSKDVPAKRPAIPLGYAPLDDKNDESKNIKVMSEKAEDDSPDVSVVRLSAEAAPKDLPPPGEISLPPVKVGMPVYAMKNAFGSWLKAKIVEILPKPSNSSFTLCRVKFEHKVTKNPFKILPARCLAYYEPPEVRLTIGRRVIALFQDTGKREAYYSGIVAEIPNPVNSYRYLIFFDDGYAQYAYHSQTRLVCECSCLVWEEVHPYSREFVRQYLFAYPERPMVRLHAGQNLKTEWRGKWWSSRVVRVDASLVQVQFVRRERREWIYRGSTRLAPLYLELQAAERHRPRAVPRAQPQARTNMPYVEYTRSDEQTNKGPEAQQQTQQQIQQQHQNEEMRRQRAVAKKSTTPAQQPPPPAGDNLDNVTSRVVYYTPKNAVKPYKMVPHTCSPKCKRTDVLALKDLRTYNPLAKPLLSGWERQIVRWKGQRAVLYVSPCGRRVRDVRELHAYLRCVRSDMPVDLFDFSPATHCLAEFVLNKCFVGKKDLSHGKENVPVPCVNYYDESLPEFCSYNTERTPTAGVPLNLDPDFLCGCDCEDDCEDKTKCACWKMTLEGARTIGLEGDNIGYVYKRLPDPLPSGIYECNSRCKCKHTCLNRVAQHPLQLKLQVFKTLNRGWGIRALNDVPKGAFLCVYAGNLLTDATANLDGLNEGDEYLAELDYIEVVEQMKEGYEEDIPEKIKKLDQKELEQQASEDTEEDEMSSEDEASNNKTDLEDDDFQPGHIGLGVAEFKLVNCLSKMISFMSYSDAISLLSNIVQNGRQSGKRLRRRDSKKQKEDENQKEKEGEKKESEKETNPDEECITISDDEEVREPSCFTAAAGMGANEFISKYRSVRTLFGEDEACYIMDAKVQGNIGRYLNHSCSPNVFVQNVFVDTHDPRFPWVAFFALSHIRAGTELTWNYNYDVGSVPGKVLYCHCGASNCRGRLL